MLEKKPFVKYSLKESEQKRIVIRLNDEEKTWLVECMKILRQPKPSTCLKQLGKIAHAYVIHDKKTWEIINTIFENDRRNKRIGIVDPNTEIKIK